MGRIERPAWSLLCRCSTCGLLALVVAEVALDGNGEWLPLSGRLNAYAAGSLPRCHDEPMFVIHAEVAP